MSKKEKTVFDYGISQEEFKKIFGYIMSEEDYRNRTSDDIKNRDIAWMHLYNGNKLKMRWYINKVKNPNIRNSFWRNASHFQK